MIGGFAVIVSGLAAALTWGLGDFAGGLASRRAAAMQVVLVSQPAGAAALVALGVVLRQPAPRLADLLWGVAAGLLGGIGLLLLYLSLARGKMGVAAPLTAIASGGIPLVVGLLTEGLPGPTQIGGLRPPITRASVCTDAVGSAAPVPAGVASAVRCPSQVTARRNVSISRTSMWPAKWASSLRTKRTRSANMR